MLDEKVDVGDTDEQETEIDLEAEPKKEEPKEEIVVEEVKEAEPAKAEETKTEEPKDELSEYSDTVKKRIAKLTRKMREAERQKEEAIEFAKKTKRRSRAT